MISKRFFSRKHQRIPQALFLEKRLRSLKRWILDPSLQGISLDISGKKETRARIFPAQKQKAARQWRLSLRSYSMKTFSSKERELGHSWIAHFFINKYNGEKRRMSRTRRERTEMLIHKQRCTTLYIPYFSQRTEMTEKIELAQKKGQSTKTRFE